MPIVQKRLERPIPVRAGAEIPAPAWQRRAPGDAASRVLGG